MDEIVASVDADTVTRRIFVAEQTKPAGGINILPHGDVEPAFAAFPVAGNGDRMTGGLGQSPQYFRHSRQIATVADRIAAQKQQIRPDFGDGAYQRIDPPQFRRAGVKMQIRQKKDAPPANRRGTRRKTETAQHYIRLAQYRGFTGDVIAFPSLGPTVKRSGER